MSTPRSGDYTRRMENRRVPLSTIHPHPDNPNTHSREQIKQLEASHADMGQFRSVMLWQRSDHYVIVGGHGYVTAAKNKGEADVRADILPEDTPPELIKRIMTADNLHARNSQEDPEKLLAIIEEQQELGIDLSVLGMDQKKLDALYKELEDESEKLPEPGDEEEETVQESFAIIIGCETEQEQAALLERFQDEGLTCRALVV